MNPSKRAHCSHCDYPLTACLCHAIVPILSANQVYVLQHPHEAVHAKNSVRLLRRVLPETIVVTGETEADFAQVRHELENSVQPTLLLYPFEHSVSLLNADIHGASKMASVNLLVIDGTWRKALKMIKLNPWLAQFQAVHLSEDYQGRYRIRKAKRPDSLSTLEATAFALSHLEPDLDVTPLLNAFEAMVQRQLAAMPASVRDRY